MPPRKYYSARVTKAKLSPSNLREQFERLYKVLEEDGYFQESFGRKCVDGDVVGKIGTDVSDYVYLHLRKSSQQRIVPIYPIVGNCKHYSEEDLLDMIEFLYDHVSKPVDGFYHNYSNCGWHYQTFDKQAGQQYFREEVNSLLVDYGDGYELTADGEIVTLESQGIEHLINATLPDYDAENVEERVAVAISKFRSRYSSSDDRRDAVRDLADVLEFLRPELKKVLIKQDESDLFNIANNFGLRHHDGKQKVDYDKNIWYSWMFYYYLATIHAAVRLINKSRSTTGS